MKLNYRRTFLVGLAFFAICSFWQLYDHVVPLMLKYTFGIGDAVSGGVMALDNVAALVLLPVFGSLSDKTMTRWGRRMPFIVVGSFGAAGIMLLIPLADRWASLPLFIVGLGLTLLLMSSYRSPAVALMPDVTMKPLRSKANAVINLMGAVGGIVLLGLINVMLPAEASSAEGMRVDYLPIFLALMGIMVIATLILIFAINEPKLAAEMKADSAAYGIEEDSGEEEGARATGKALPPAVKRSMGFLLASIALWFMGYNAVTTSFSKYCVEVFGLGAGGSALVLMVAQAAAIISYIPVGFVATALGRKKTILGGVVMLAVAFGAGSFFGSLSLPIYILFILAGIAWASINVNSYPMVVEMAQGADVGKFTGYYYMASMSAQIATPIISGFALQFISYRTLFPYGALFVALSFVTMLFVRHGDSRPAQYKSKLEAFEAMDD